LAQAKVCDAITNSGVRSFGVRQLAAALAPASSLVGQSAIRLIYCEQARGQESGSKLPHSKTLRPRSIECDTSQTVTTMVVAAPHSRLFSSARVKNMGTEMIVGVVIVSPVIFSAAALLWAPEEWLRAFVILARSLGRPM
jgi:hypothetical protein